MALKFFKRIISGLSALNATGYCPADQVPHCYRYDFVVKFGPGTSAGAVVIEAARSNDDTDTWVLLATVTWAAANKSHDVSVDAAKLALRARISVAIVGGIVDVDAQGVV